MYFCTARLSGRAPKSGSKPASATNFFAAGVTFSLYPVSATLEVDGNYDLAEVKVTYLPGGTNTHKDITWSITTGNEFATLDGTVVTAVKEGAVVLTATTANGKTAEFTLTVTEEVVPVETFTVNFVKDDGTVVKSFTEQTAETAITVPGETPVSTKGYDVFDGWYLNGDVSSPVTGTYTVKAEDAKEGVITIKAVYKQTVHVEKWTLGACNKPRRGRGRSCPNKL